MVIPIMAEYKNRDLIPLQTGKNLFMKHFVAITTENLNSKSKIAAELAYRDSVIDKLREALEACDEAMEYMSEYDIPLMLPEQVKSALETCNA